MDLTNGQLTPNNNTPLLTQALSGEVMLGIYAFVFKFIFKIFLRCLSQFSKEFFSYKFIFPCITVMNNYQAAAQGFPPASPHTQTTTRTGFPAANSPGPTIDMYSSSGADSVNFVQATSPQPSGFPTIAVSRAPLNYSPVSSGLKMHKLT